MNKEFVIWGIAPEETEEEILILNHNNERITEIKIARIYARLMEERYNCKNVRIQEIDFSEDFSTDFVEGINNSKPTRKL